MKKGIITMMFGVLVSCQSQEKRDHEPMNLIIKSSKDFVTEDGGHIDEEYGTTQEFEKHHLKVQFLEDTIYAEAVQYVNACGDAKAWVRVEEDTLILTTKEQKEELCNSANWYKYQYWIENIENKKYVIRQEE